MAKLNTKQQTDTKGSVT